ncbi:asparagine--tRNA ligase [Piscirickettsia salmonis]|uniref:Asparagine--tRNA ligase n=2 Tax=Piscirickettsia salmonis TaxID=1238 RepID=A0A9Q6LT91_PISSA|nr:asparagine--tRNA ligase [Piscirickettsia salmonis]ALA23603.1 asparaginyl-tRNA synthetase [Piscirickettsia salmonis]APS44050.1 asparagine--tRNA ligase [Piscirickettsia salmonis]APS47409.1 asparagine--tRNA ligase [Piscirickettsia salmonis]APS51156.1 asparagine--tRNA ligase [Piscirickettsia salmonis]APS54364.1 asparagine--tRNA ligase [Piscirickettsia salmonis]
MTMSVKAILAGAAKVGDRVTVKGWVRTKRDSKAGISFVAINDGSCFDSVQVIAANSLTNYESEIAKLTKDCAVIASGELVESPGQGQSFEVQATDIQVVGWVEKPESYPVSPKRHTVEYLREVAHLRPRTNLFAAVTRVRNCISQAIHRFLSQEGFAWVHTPLITASDCEGAGEMFRVSTLDMLNLPRTDKGAIDYSQDFFGQESFLTVSGQLNVEAYCLAMSKVYTFGPTFRAENSNTSRHLAEFWMIEPEIAFADLNDNAALAERMLKFVSTALLEQCADDMAFFAARVDKQALTRLETISQSNFEIMDYTTAIEQLLKADKSFEFPVAWGVDLASEHERYLCEELVGKPVTVMNYPKDIKSFYMRLNEDGRTVAAMDVLAPGVGEIIGGSQREERLDVLKARMQEIGVSEQHLDWYLDLRRYGTVPHAGFGLGLERLVSYVTGVANVRDVIPFPRTPGNIPF